MKRWSRDRAERAEQILAQYPQPRSAVMPLLYLAMAEHGYLSNQAMAEVAGLTGLTPAQVLSAASFYTMYKRAPVGKYLVSVCTSISCHLLGGEAVLEAVERATATPHGETSQDQVFSVEHVECLGACGGAPAVQVNYELVEGINPERAKLLCEWLRRAAPACVRADEMQALFGGQRSFDWGPPDRSGATVPVPAFGPLGTLGEE